MNLFSLTLDVPAAAPWLLASKHSKIVVTTYFPPGLALCPPFLSPPSSSASSVVSAAVTASQLLAPSSLLPHQHLQQQQSQLPASSHHHSYVTSLPLTTTSGYQTGIHHHPAAAHNPALCYCGHCCPQPASLVGGAVAPTLILSRYTEINLCDSLTLRNQQHQAAAAAAAATATFANGYLPSLPSSINTHNQFNGKEMVSVNEQTENTPMLEDLKPVCRIILAL
ncbi:hypothetical protein DMENIID0001_087010 [Sergentomyia squamirostris]